MARLEVDHLFEVYGSLPAEEIRPLITDIDKLSERLKQELAKKSGYTVMTLGRPILIQKTNVIYYDRHVFSSNDLAEHEMVFPAKYARRLSRMIEED